MDCPTVALKQIHSATIPRAQLHRLKLKSLPLACRIHSDHTVAQRANNFKLRLSHTIPIPFFDLDGRGELRYLHPPTESLEPLPVAFDRRRHHRADQFDVLCCRFGKEREDIPNQGTEGLEDGGGPTRRVACVHQHQEKLKRRAEYRRGAVAHPCGTGWTVCLV
eukprot:CAMPEP_0114565644 /NCGR_PEP_ID=MMETSP0114-20121206/14425_1 /TAXON_ID=31324 /ORGANISM="Goniomonas sp, Strain m" /LENGTH=163 /DNA_ID=CAMNT_0001751915 /DNA_START=79 /DNA_END=570 /DNA_ORIENTATION=-